MGDKILELMEGNGYKISTILLFVALVYVIINLDKVMLLQSWFWGLFSNFFSFAKKKQISGKVRGTILKSIKEQPSLKEEIIPTDLKVVWVDSEEVESFVNNNQVIVRIKQSSNPHENLVTAVSEYVNNGLLYNVKRYLNKEVMDGSRILMTRKVIQAASKSSLNYLDEKYVFPQMEKDEELKEIYDSLNRIDNNGMFIGILLNEFSKAGMTIYGEVEDPELIAESKEFMRFLYNIATRISSDSTDLSFNRDYFKVAIFLSASNKTLKYSGIKVFVKAITAKLNEGIETIYIFGLGSKREIAKQISEEMDSDFRIRKIEEHRYKHVNESGRRVPGVFYECEIYKNEEV